MADQQIRELERQVAAGDIEARKKLDNVKLRMGESPSWDYMLEEYEKAVQLQKDHLFKVIEAELAAYFEKHRDSGVEKLSWSIADRPDLAGYGWSMDSWIEGLSIVIDSNIWEENCQAADPGYGAEFNAETLASHLKGICDCRKSSNEPARCWIGGFGWF